MSFLSPWPRRKARGASGPSLKRPRRQALRGITAAARSEAEDAASGVLVAGPLAQGAGSWLFRLVSVTGCSDVLRLLLWPEGPRRGEAAWLLPGLWPKGAVTYCCCHPSLGQRRSASTCLLPFQGPKGGEGARLRPGLGSKGGVLVSVLLGLGPRRQ